MEKATNWLGKRAGHIAAIVPIDIKKNDYSYGGGSYASPSRFLKFLVTLWIFLPYSLLFLPYCFPHRLPLSMVCCGGDSQI